MIYSYFFILLFNRWFEGTITVPLLYINKIKVKSITSLNYTDQICDSI